MQYLLATGWFKLFFFSSLSLEDVSLTLFVCLPLWLELLLKFSGNSCICLLHSKSEHCSLVINHIHSVNVFLRKFLLCCQLERKETERRAHRRLQWWQQNAWGCLEVRSLRVDCDDGGTILWSLKSYTHGKLNRFETWKVVFTLNMDCFVDQTKCYSRNKNVGLISRRHIWFRIQFRLKAVMYPSFSKNLLTIYIFFFLVERDKLALKCSGRGSAVAYSSHFSFLFFPVVYVWV